MAGSHALVLSSGGLRSLVAIALTRQDLPDTRLTLLHVVDGRPNRVPRLDHTYSQAEHFGIKRVVEMDLPHLYDHGHGKQPDGRPMGPLVPAQILLLTLAQARLLQADTVIWPASFDGNTGDIARASEQMLLCEHLAELESQPTPQFDAPLLEMTDQQIIEVGGQLDVPWQRAWSCLGHDQKPCRVCTTCVRRKRAFTKAGMTDPADEKQ